MAQSCPTLCSPMDCSMPGLPIYHQLPELAQTRVHRGGDAIQPSHPLSLLLLPSIFPSIRVFSNESFLLIRWPKYWSCSFSISPFNENSGLISFRIDWLPSLLSKGLSGVFSSTTVQNKSFSASLFYGPTLTSMRDHRENHSFHCKDLCRQIGVSAF